jgi:hypothetical protein
MKAASRRDRNAPARQAFRAAMGLRTPVPLFCFGAVFAVKRDHVLAGLLLTPHSPPGAYGEADARRLRIGFLNASCSRSLRELSRRGDRRFDPGLLFARRRQPDLA